MTYEAPKNWRDRARRKRVDRADALAQVLELERAYRRSTHSRSRRSAIRSSRITPSSSSE